MSTREAQDIELLIESYDTRPLVRFVMCGSVDDGKSTLIGRLLYESGSVFDDQLASLAVDSRRHGTQGGGLDLALLMDGLADEREQGITIDVAYRHFSTARRHYIVADAPGHEQYTRNLVTGASTADCGVVLVDARQGVLTQTRRHSHILALLGVRDVVLAVNKMDLVGYSTERFVEIERDYCAHIAMLGIDRVTCIPVSALNGDNVLRSSDRIAGYGGPTLMEYLETVEVGGQRALEAPFRMPVQWVNRQPDFRGYTGMIASGTVRRGDGLVVALSGRRTTVARLIAGDAEVERAVAGQAVTITLADELDVGRGEVLSDLDQPAGTADQFEATIIWMADEPLLRGRSYLMRLGAATVPATIMPIKYVLDINSLEHLAATKLELNEIGVCDLELSRPVAFDPYVDNRDTGGFILIDRITNATVAAGLIHFALRRSANVRWQQVDIDKRERARSLHQQPTVLWLTGLSGAGKSTIANLLESELHRRGHHTYLLDGDNVRHGLNADLGFTAADRVENIRRVGQVARLMADAGLIVLVAFISPFQAEREMVRSLLAAGEFLEIFVDAPLAVVEQRDPKGLYRKARRGELRNFTGIDSPYEPPARPELRLDTAALAPVDSARQVLELLQARGRLQPPE